MVPEGFQPVWQGNHSGDSQSLWWEWLPETVHGDRAGSGESGQKPEPSIPRATVGLAGDISAGDRKSWCCVHVSVFPSIRVYKCTLPLIGRLFMKFNILF